MYKYIKAFAPILMILFVPIILTANESIISYLEGDVVILRENEEFQAEFGIELYQGDVIKTGPQGLAVIELAKSRTLKITENTLLYLEETGTNTTLELRAGSIFAKIKNLTSDSFTIHAEKVAAGIRGTEFFIAYGRRVEDSPDIWLCVNEGAVEVSLLNTDNSVVVKEGEGINILSGRNLTDPRFYSWTNKLNWNNNPDNGSVKNSISLDNAYTDLLNQDYF